MGKRGSKLSTAQTEYFDITVLQRYSECTFFTEQEISRLYLKFSELNPSRFPSSGRGYAHVRLSFQDVQSLPQLKECPFALRLCQVFSTGDNGLNFEDFLDMMSVFSRRAPWNLKASYAFQILDYDNDGLIGKNDIRTAIYSITGEYRAVTHDVIKILNNPNGGLANFSILSHYKSLRPLLIEICNFPLANFAMRYYNTP